MCLTLCYYVINSTELSDHLSNLTQHALFSLPHLYLCLSYLTPKAYKYPLTQFHSHHPHLR